MENTFEFCVLINNYCNVNCPYCSNFMLCKRNEPKYDLSINVAKFMLRTIKHRLKPKNKYKYIWHLFGGETILSPNYIDLAELFINDPDTELVKISTNGTVPFTDRAISVLKNDKILVRVSYHLDALKYMSNCDKWIESVIDNTSFLIDNGVRVGIYILANNIEGEKAIALRNRLYNKFGNCVSKIYMEVVISNKYYNNPYYDIKKYSALYEKTTKYVYPYRSIYIHSDMGLTYRCEWVKHVYGNKYAAMDFNDINTWNTINSLVDYKFDCQYLDCWCKSCFDCDGEITNARSSQT